MPTNDFIPFATGGGANVESQSAYIIDPQVPIGQQPGVAKSALNNKALRQATSIAAALAQFMSNLTGQDVADDGVQANLLANLAAAFPYAFTPITAKFWSGNFSGVIWSNTGAYADPAVFSGSPVLTAYGTPTISVSAASGNLPGITFTPDSINAIYMISATSALDMENAGSYPMSAQLVAGSTPISSVPSFITTNPFAYPIAFSGVPFKPGVVTPYTVKIQIGGAGGGTLLGSAALGNSIELSLLRIA